MLSLVALVNFNNGQGIVLQMLVNRLAAYGV